MRIYEFVEKLILPAISCDLAEMEKVNILVSSSYCVKSLERGINKKYW